MLIYLMALDTEEERIKFVRLYEEYRNRMHYTASILLKSEIEAEDIVHDTFLTLTDYLDRIDEKDSVGTWNYIVTILKNRCFDWMRKQKYYKYTDDKENFNVEESLDAKENIFKNHLEEEIIIREKQELLIKLIMNLKYPYKEVLYLQYYNELGSKEIGEILSIKPDNVRKIASRARKILKEKMIEMGYGR